MVEIVVTLIFLIVAYFSMIRPMWDQKFLEQITSQWNKGPIVDLRVVS